MPNEVTENFNYLPFGGGRRKCIGAALPPHWVSQRYCQPRCREWKPGQCYLLAEGFKVPLLMWACTQRTWLACR